MNEEKKYRLPTADEILSGLDNPNYVPEPTVEDRVLRLEKIIEQIHRDIDYIKKGKVKPKIVKVKEKLKVKKSFKKKVEKGVILSKEKEEKIIVGRKKLEVKIPNELIEKKNFTRAEFQELLKIDTRKANRILKKLIKEEKIERRGSRTSPKVFYKIIEASK